MQKIYLLALTFLVAAPTLFGQYAIRGDAPFGNGFGGSDLVFEDPAFGGTRRLVVRPTNTMALDKFFRLVTNDTNNNRAEVGPTDCSGDQDITANEGQEINGAFPCTNGAYNIDATVAGETYVFKTPASDNSGRFIYYRLTDDIEEVTAVSQLPAGDVAPGVPVMVTATVSNGGFGGNGQAAYLRYTTDNFASSTVVEMTANGDGTYSATIPGQVTTDMTTVTYYVFTSGDAQTIAGTDADFKTINLNNGGGSNYSYTVNLALPVSFSSWNGRRVKNAVRLSWATATEENAAHFEVECSADAGRTWMRRTRVPARNLRSGAEYAYTDAGAPAGDLQYRLRQIDQDGAFTYSGIITVAAAGPEVQLWPQPASAGTLNLRAAGHAGTEARLYAATGQLLLSFPVTGERQLLPVTGLAPGVYLLRLAGERPLTRRVVIR